MGVPRSYRAGADWKSEGRPRSVYTSALCWMLSLPRSRLSEDSGGSLLRGAFAVCPMADPFLRKRPRWAAGSVGTHMDRGYLSEPILSAAHAPSARSST
jgi:hypothetical protein